MALILGLIDGVDEEPAFAFLISLPVSKAATICRWERGPKAQLTDIADTGVEGELALGAKCLNLAPKFARFSAAGLCENDDPPLLMQVGPSAIELEIVAEEPPKRALVIVCCCGTKATLKIDKLASHPY